MKFKGIDVSVSGINCKVEYCYKRVTADYVANIANKIFFLNCS